MTSDDIRRHFIDFFTSHGHKLVSPATLVPKNDPSLLFTVAGMQQFKDDYQHPEQAPAPRVITIQPCIRTKDIDEVGDDTHLTVFDMLGFFSFGFSGEETPDGPYFKPTALRLAWEFFTARLGINPHDVRITYFAGDDKRPEDVGSREIIKDFAGLGQIDATVDDNFWGPVGQSGPCGPCVEFYYRDVEIGNVVFNQYTKDKEGNYSPLPRQGVDTGLGFERIVTLLQGKSNVYQTDLFAATMATIRSQSANYDEKQARIVADHAKAAMYLIAEGVAPGTKGREYIVRRLIRRAVRAGTLMAIGDVSAVLVKIADAEFEPLKNPTVRQQAIRVFEQERQKFLITLEQGTRALKKLTRGTEKGEITGNQAFHLFETYGFPVELTAEIAQELGWTVDLTGFEELMAKHRETSRAGADKLFTGGLADHEPKTVAHHTAHHLLLAALRQVLGRHVVQRGSNVTSERLRIDVSHSDKISDDELKMAEEIVNQRIAEDLPVVAEQMDRDEAIKLGALAEFGVKYPEQVTVYSIIDQNGEAFSRELCGGPHVGSTGELGQFEILKEEASGAGIRRIRARIIS